ncbi:DUF3987 domain-containing protein [Bacillus badius]|uniref:YfjI family protein n=1 Tax=Bacillus badius TaxID=1455 RepID=UPI001CBD16A7|nr:YfjI family protein [Bacillus badius]UAT31466.1 DUF3987 domain-containing protein [Bacillus badius]
MKDVASIAARLLPKEQRQAINDLDMSSLTRQLAPEHKESQEWERPILFEDYTLPPFPTNIFPDWLKNYVEAVAEATQTPKDMASMAAISVLSIAAAKKFEINVYGSWIEPLNTYTITLMGSANRKSSVFELMTRPILQFEKEERERLKIEIRNRKSEIKALEKRLEHVINTNAKKPDQKYIEEIKRINEELEALPEIYSPSFIIDDITPESLQKALEENGEKIGVLSAEGGIFEIIRGRYSKELNMDIFLKGHSGDYSRTDRKHGMTMIVEKPTLTIGIFAQPDVLQDLPKAFNGRGLMARFLFSLPKDFRGYRKIRPKDISSSERSEYTKYVRRLLELEMGGTQRLILTEKADYYFQYLQQNIEERLRDDGDLSEFSDWGGKIVGQLARIAGLLHIAKHITNGVNIPLKIEEETILSLLELKEYLINHAMAAHGCMGTNDELEQLKYLLSVIKRKSKERYEKKPTKEIMLAYRDIQQWTKKRFKKSVFLKNALQELEQYGYIRGIEEGRKVFYQINPFIFTDALKTSPTFPDIEKTLQSQYINTGEQAIPEFPPSPNSPLFKEKEGEDGECGERWELKREHDKQHSGNPQQQLGEQGERFERNRNDPSFEDESELI